MYIIQNWYTYNWNERVLGEYECSKKIDVLKNEEVVEAGLQIVLKASIWMNKTC